MSPWADPEVGQGARTPSEKSQKNKEFLSNTGPDPLKNHRATKPAFNVVQSPARQWRFADGPMMTHYKLYLDPLSAHQLTEKRKKKRYQICTPSDKTFWIRAVAKNITSHMTARRHSKASSSLFLSRLAALTERTLSSAKQNKDQTQSQRNNGSTLQ